VTEEQTLMECEISLRLPKVWPRQTRFLSATVKEGESKMREEIRMIGQELVLAGI
jgi:hypothetical protein